MGGASASPAIPAGRPVEFRLTPHYRLQSPLEKVLGKVEPGSDIFLNEKYAQEILGMLGEWRRSLEKSPPAPEVIGEALEPKIEATSLTSFQETTVRDSGGLQVRQRRFRSRVLSGKETVLREWVSYLAPLAKLHTAEFEIIGIETQKASPLTLGVQLRYDLVGDRNDGRREERIGHWLMEWMRRGASRWQIRSWKASEEIVSLCQGSAFVDVTSRAFSSTESFKHQLLPGVDYWRTVLDGACGIDVYGNQGVAVGDAHADGLDDLYVCQPSGLPNRLLRNRGDGTFEDVTEPSGLGILDGTACALFADFDNNGLQDLLVVTGAGPLLFLNQGKGRFELHKEAFKFAKPPQGTFTAAAVADYDRDGLLDVYFCVYNYYLGLDQYHYPVPYFDARNGPPNFLFHNEGNSTFRDATSAAGMNVDNNGYSFACAWQDFDGDGFPDLYVANDFGRKNLYRNNGDGTFTDVAPEAGVEDIGAGMSASWFDYDNDGNPDLYVGDMWSSSGMRVTSQMGFQKNCPEDVRELYQKHARGNSLFRNRGAGRFEDASSRAGVEFGRWAWSSDAWDFDHDGFADLYIANGYISAPEADDVASFFWRQVVGQSPSSAVASRSYEQGWNAINELIRSDHSWSGRERNVFYANNRDGTFSEVSGAVGLDLPEDGRAFSLSDLDQDGRLEVILKNRNGPQLRILRNALEGIGNSLVLRLRGHKSNRDAIGARVTVQAGGLRQTKSLQAGSGFLSQHTKELHFGLGQARGPARATIQWPSGLTQEFLHLEPNQRIEIEEGVDQFKTTPFRGISASWAGTSAPPVAPPLPPTSETWLIEPLLAPDFSLSDLTGRRVTLQSFRGRPVWLTFWAPWSPPSRTGLLRIQKAFQSFHSTELQVVALSVYKPGEEQAVRSFVASCNLSFDILLASEEASGVYNIIYRYLFDRRRDLEIPTSFLVDEKGFIIKVFQGPADPAHILSDLQSLPRTRAERLKKALPFGGTLYGDEFRRNDFTYGVAFFQRGYLDQAVASFRQVIATEPDYPEAYYNLGTLYLKKDDLATARGYLERAVKLRVDYPDAWNNLGMIAAQQGQTDEAVRHFRQAITQKPDYGVAIENLGNLYRRQGSYPEAEKLLNQALEIDPDDPEFNYNLGMLFAQQADYKGAEAYLQKAVQLRPDYPDALNNLGVLMVREGRPREAAEKFEESIRVAPDQDQGYFNLARVFMMLGNKEKARDALRRLLKRNPQNQAAQQALNQLR
jgi:tetratricopeptide (TPR) repeat protein/peroxiredoxin